MVLAAVVGGGVGDEVSSQPLTVGVDELVSPGTVAPESAVRLPKTNQAMISTVTTAIAPMIRNVRSRPEERPPPPPVLGAGSEGLAVVSLDQAEPFQ